MLSNFSCLSYVLLSLFINYYSNTTIQRASIAPFNSFSESRYVNTLIVHVVNTKYKLKLKILSVRP